MKRAHKRLSLLLPAVLLAFIGDTAAVAADGANTRKSNVSADGLYAEVTTPRGAFTCELYFRRTPLTVASFVGLAEGKLGPAPRKPFFDGLKFHRVVPDFVI